MDIYDEAIKGLEAFRKELQERLNFPVNLTPEYRVVKKALERAKKVEELNKLLNEKCDYLVHIMNGGKGLQDNYIKLLRKINDLEKELEEIK